MIMVATFVVGLALAPLNAALSTLIQIAVPDEMLGRVSSVADTAMTLSYLVSMGGAAFLGEALGIRAVFMASGIVTALAALPALSMMKEPEIGAPGLLRKSVVPSADQLVEV
jgi:predicted MFS family arabinose efflux permease